MKEEGKGKFTLEETGVRREGIGHFVTMRKKMEKLSGEK